DAGGLVLVQDEFTAKFNGMPRAATETGVVDAAFSPTEMPGYLAAYQKDPASPIPQEAEGELEGIDAVLSLLNRHHEIDFSLYKPATVHRRIERRILLGPEPTIDAYVDRLREDPDELNRLYKDLLIGVTQFFRDASAYDSLQKHVIPNIFQARSAEEEIRIWVAGCATGEEAYSLAILFDEARRKLGRETQPIRIFATDAHRTSIDFAASGRYEADSLREVMPDRLNRYFAPIGSEFQVVPALRQMITFAPQNMISDAPFTRMDLVTCRNVLIYFRQQVQTQVLSLLHFALNAGGFLFLGPSETTQPFREEFEAMDPHWRIYRKRRDVRLLSTARLPTRTPTLTSPVRSPMASPSAAGLAPDHRLLRVYDTLLEESIDASVLINDRREVVHVFGNARNLLKLPAGRRAYDVLSMLDEPLKPAVGTAIQRCQQQEEAVSVGAVRLDPETVVAVSARPVAGGVDGDTHILIKLERQNRPAPEAVSPDDSQVEFTFDADGVNQQRIVALEQELQYTKENLQTTIEELETSNEELNATNEELIASNEELQSTNEELHSVNEELHTVNAEYQQKITELTQLTDDMNNLLASTEIGTLFVDRNLRVRRFTPAIGDLMKLREADVDRPLDEISPRFEYERLLEDANSALRTGEIRQVEVQAKDSDRHYLLRINPYRLANGNIDGLVFTFVDVSQIKAAEAATEAERQVTQEILDTLPSMVFFKDDQNRIIRTNQASADNTGFTKQEMQGQPTDKFFPNDAQKYYRDDLEVIRSGKPKLGIVEQITTSDGDRRWIRTDKLPLRGVGGIESGLVAVVSDITDIKRTQSELEAVTERFEAFMSNSPAVKWAVDQEGRFVFVNPAFERMMHVESADCLGRRPADVLAENTSLAFLHRSSETSAEARSGGQPITFEVEVPVGEDRYQCLVTKFVFRDPAGRELIGGSALDISSLKQAQRELEELNADLEERVQKRTAELVESEQRFQAVSDNAPIMMWMNRPDGQNAWCNRGYREFTGMTQEQLAGEGWADAVHPDDRTGMVRAWEKTVADRDPWDYEFRARRADGEYRWMFAYGMPRYGHDGAFLGYIGTVADVTDRREAEEQLKRAHDELERRVEARTGELRVNVESLAARNRELDQFAHAASHDLRSPLRTILGFAEHLQAMESDGIGQDERDAIARITAAAERMSRLIDSLLLFATVGRGELDLEAIDPAAVVEQVGSDLASEIESAGAALVVNTPLPTIVGDASMIRQVFQNLISNAIKYRRDEPPRVEVSGNKNNGVFEFSVADNGTGLKPEDVERAFEPFQRLHAGKENRGTGIGLSICRRVIKRHGGNIRAQSEPGRGTTFTFTIPSAELKDDDS
ncbi:MAG: PAS domain S-box protein, partial [Planctomycetota bacterium]